MVVALGVMAMKLVAWRLTGSVALYSDALESTVNVVAAALAWMTIRISRKPPDANHPFGHHKVEYFSAVIEGILIVLAAIAILMEIRKTLVDPAPITEPVLGLAIVCVATGINAALGMVLLREGRAAKSPALSADGAHVMADVWTSLAVIAGLLINAATGLPYVDQALAAMVAVNVLWQGFRLVSQSVDGLMDHAVGPEDQALIEAAITENAKGATGVHDLKTRVAGRVTFVEFHLLVPATMRVRDSHAICDRLETALARAIPRVRTTIHVEPDDMDPHGHEVSLQP